MESGPTPVFGVELVDALTSSFLDGPEQRRKAQLQFHLQWFFTADRNGCIPLILLVGAGRFERPTPCAQGGFRHGLEMACFQLLRFQRDAASLLQLVEL
jgi:hypothetical protein